MLMPSRTETRVATALRALPSVDELLRAAALRELAPEVSHDLLVAAARTVLGRWREAFRTRRLTHPPERTALAGST